SPGVVASLLEPGVFEDQARSKEFPGAAPNRQAVFALPQAADAVPPPNAAARPRWPPGVPLAATTIATPSSVPKQTDTKAGKTTTMDRRPTASLSPPSESPAIWELVLRQKYAERSAPKNRSRRRASVGDPPMRY